MDNKIKFSLMVLFLLALSSNAFAIDVPFSIELRNTTNHLVTGANDLSIAISDNTSDCTNSLIINKTFTNGIINGNSNGTTIIGLNNVSCGRRYGVCVYINGAVQGGTQNMTLCNGFFNESGLNSSSIFNVGGINSSGDLNSTSSLNISKNATIGGNFTINGARTNFTNDVTVKGVLNANLSASNISGTLSVQQGGTNKANWSNTNRILYIPATDSIADLIVGNGLSISAGTLSANPANMTGFGSANFFAVWANGSVVNYSTIIQESVLGSAINITGHLNISKNLTVNGNIYGNLGCGNITGATSNLCTITSGASTADNNSNVSGFGSANKFAIWFNGSQINYSTVIQESVIGSSINITGHLNISKNLTVTGNIYGNVGCGNITGATSNLCTITSGASTADNNSNVSGFGSAGQFGRWVNGSVINYSTVLFESVLGSAINITGSLNVSKNLTVSGNIYGTLGCGNISGASSNLCTLIDSNSRADNNSNISGFGSANKFAIWSNGSLLNYSTILQESILGSTVNITGQLNVTGNVTAGYFVGNISCSNITGATSNLCSITASSGRADNNSNVSGYGLSYQFALWSNGSSINYSTILNESVLGSTINISGHLNVSKNLTVNGNIYGNLGCGNITGATSNLCSITASSGRADNNSNVSGFGSANQFAIWTNGSNINYSTVLSESALGVAINITGHLNISKNLTVSGNIYGNLGCGNITGATSNLCTITSGASTADNNSNVSGFGSAGQFGRWVNGSVINYSTVLFESVLGSAINITGSLNVSKNLTVSGNIYGTLGCGNISGASSNLCTLIDSNSRADNNSNVSGYGSANKFGLWANGSLINYSTILTESILGSTVNITGQLNVTGNVTAGYFVGNISCGNITGATSNLCSITASSGRADNNSNVSGYGLSYQFALWSNGSQINYSTILNESVLGSTINISGHLNVSKNLTVNGNIYGNLGCGNITGATSALCTLTDTNSRADNNSNISGFGSSKQFGLWVNGSVINYSTILLESALGVAINISGHLNVSSNLTVNGNIYGNLGCGNITGATSNLCTITSGSGNANISGFGTGGYLAVFSNGSSINSSSKLQDNGSLFNITEDINLSGSMNVSGNVNITGALTIKGVLNANLSSSNVSGTHSIQQGGTNKANWSNTNRILYIPATDSIADLIVGAGLTISGGTLSTTAANANVTGFGSANFFAIWFNGSLVNYSTIMQESVIGSAINISGHLNISKNLTVSGNIYGNLGCGNITGATSNLCTITSGGGGGSSTADNNSNVSGFGSANKFAIWANGSVINYSTTLQESVVGSAINVTGHLNISKNLTVSGNIYGNLGWNNLTGFPAACPAGQTAVQVGSTLTCSPFLSSTNLAIDPFTNDFRLTLRSNTPVVAEDIVGATTLYFTPYKGNMIATYNGTNWTLMPSGEVSLSIGSLSNGTNYDVFVFANATNISLELSLPWTDNTTRNNTIIKVNGVRMLNNSGTNNITRRLVGTIRTNSTTTTNSSTTIEDNALRRFVINEDNAVPRIMQRTETTGSWTFSSLGWRPMNNNTANRVEYLQGLYYPTYVRNQQLTSLSGSNVGHFVGIGLDSTTNTTTFNRGFRSQGGSGAEQILVVYNNLSAEGYHFIIALENSGGSTSMTWTGTATGVTGYNVEMGLDGYVWA